MPQEIIIESEKAVRLPGLRVYARYTCTLIMRRPDLDETDLLNRQQNI